MSGSIVGKILAPVILIILCFIIGAQAAESAFSSGLIIAVLFGVVFMLIMGPRSWMLIFILPPIWSVIPKPGVLAVIPGSLLFASLVLGYWLVMWMMGYVRFTWRSLLVLDILVLILAIHAVALYIHRPVSVLVLGIDTDNIGGADYIMLALGCIYYIALSCIPFDEKKFSKVLRAAMILTVTLSPLAAMVTVLRGGGNIEMGESVAESRFGALSQAGAYLLYFLYCSRPMVSFFCNPLLMLGAVVSGVFMLLNGGRAYVGTCFATIVSISIIKREFTILLAICVMSCAAVYTLSASGELKHFPFGIQRALSVLPGIQVKGEIQRAASGTWQWRLDLWSLALDKRTGYIRDYTFGDGFGQSKAATERRGRALIRGEYLYGELDEFAVNGVWHNGAITTVHRMGYVGLATVSILLLTGSFFMLRTCMAFRGTDYFVPVTFFTASYFAFIPMFCVGHESMRGVFVRFVPLALIKLMYCIARDKGIIVPWIQRKRYIPKMIKDYGERLRPVQQA